MGLPANLVPFEVSSSNDPRRASTRLCRGKNAFSDETTNRGGAERKREGRLFQSRLATFGALSFAIDRDLILTPQGADAPPRPAVSLAGYLAGAVEQSGDRLVRHLSRQCPNEFDHLNISRPSRLSGAVLPYSQTSMIAALPMNDKLQCVFGDIDNDFRDDCPNDFLPRLRCGAGAFPSAKQVATKRHKALAVDFGERRRFVGVKPFNLGFEFTQRDEAVIPSALQLAGYKPILGIGGIILAMRSGRLIASLL